MSDDFDSRYEFKDNQGHKFPVWAGSQAEAWNIAQRTIAAHDAAHQREQAQAEAEREARAERVQSVINTEYDRVRAKFDAQISAGCDPRSGLRGVTHIPWGPTDEAARGIGVDGGACAIDEKPWLRNGAAQATRAESVSGGSMAATLAAVLIAFGSIACLCSSCGEIVRIP